MQTSTSVIGRTFVVRTNVSTRLCRPNAGIRPLSKVTHKAIMIANTSKAREREQRVGQTMNGPCAGKVRAGDEAAVRGAIAKPLVKYSIYLYSRSSTISPIARLLVSPGLSIAKRLMNPGKPSSSWMIKSWKFFPAVAPVLPIFGLIPQ
jgi:hypothetical protein